MSRRTSLAALVATVPVVQLGTSVATATAGLPGLAAVALGVAAGLGAGWPLAARVQRSTR